MSERYKNQKPGQDALVKEGILENDGWKDIVGFTDRFFIDKNNPRIEVEIEEAES